MTQKNDVDAKMRMWQVSMGHTGDGDQALRNTQMHHAYVCREAVLVHCLQKCARDVPYCYKAVRVALHVLLLALLGDHTTTNKHCCVEQHINRCQKPLAA